MKTIHTISSYSKSLKNILFFLRTEILGASLIIAIFISTTQSVSALAFCITNSPPTCGITATIVPSSYSIPSGSTLGLTYEARSIFENGNLFEGFTDSIEESVTGVTYYLPGSWSGSTGYKSQSGTVGPFTHDLTITLFADDQQGDTGYDSAFITVVAAPPTVNTQFSFLDEAKKFLQAILVAAKKPDTYAIVSTVSAESR